MYLSSPRVNIAEESVEDHRVQLQCKFDEMEGKYTEAKPRCTCPSYESNLHQVGEVQHLLPLDLMLVHFRPKFGTSSLNKIWRKTREGFRDHKVNLGF